jgi:hypothetical protein
MNTAERFAKPPLYGWQHSNTGDGEIDSQQWWTSVDVSEQTWKISLHEVSIHGHVRTPYHLTLKQQTV